ncbi:MAG: hypothetical protein PHZ26_01050 [Candidatus Gracilibacteria bacterium]|nr:hypothetical protein [Candidatus Gracilibacteria bacterium]MDD2908322.1 hypothetical protein [Candidatus Gracilibacteria bacterium]
MENNNEPAQEEMNEFMKNEFPEETEKYNELVKLSNNSENIYKHSIRNFVLLFFIPIIIVLVLELLIKLGIIK